MCINVCVTVGDFNLYLILEIHFVYNTYVKCRTSTLKRVFLHCGIDTFTSSATTNIVFNSDHIKVAFCLI